MKKIYIYIFALLASVVTSCEKPVVVPSTDIELIPEAGYIRFSTGVASKTPIIDNLRGEKFGVFGYSYLSSTNWATARPLATPNVFYKLEVDCDDNGVCTYDADPATPDLQYEPWRLSNRYSFFAYYPMQGVTVSGEDDVNMPVITYSLPLEEGSNGLVNPDRMIDLMTAYSIDQTARGSGEVDFTFQHRLFCIAVIAQNFNKDEEDMQGVVTKEADLYVSNLKLTIGNLNYITLTVPMQKGDELVKPIYTPKEVAADNKIKPFSASFDISNGEIKVPSQDDNSARVSLSGDRNVMLIPQDATLAPFSGSVSFDLDGTSYTKTFNSRLNFQEGKKYNIVISFTGENIIVSVAEAGSWEPHSVPFEFE